MGLDLEILSSKMKKVDVFAPQIMHDRDGANVTYSKEQLRSMGCRYYVTCVPPLLVKFGTKSASLSCCWTQVWHKSSLPTHCSGEPYLFLLRFLKGLFGRG